jgi:hypothetical protein
MATSNGVPKQRDAYKIALDWLRKTPLGRQGKKVDDIKIYLIKTPVVNLPLSHHI